MAVDRYKATMENLDCFPHSPAYWRITIEANSLKELNNLCRVINLIRIGDSKNKNDENPYPLKPEGKV